MRRLQTSLACALSAAGIALSCTTSLPPGASSPLDAGVGSGVPATHRATGTPCPAGRAAGTLAAGCAYDSGAVPACTADTDCTAGTNGRCLPGVSVPCEAACSYDTCASDADCGSGPCVCRASTSDSAANACAPGGCAVDADCGPSGYCSPSGLVDGCGLGYYCHTSSDTCLDNAGCPPNEGCSFDPSSLAWACIATCTRPP